MTLMVALVGEQTMPNLLPVRHYHPEKVLLVYTARTKNKYELLRATLQKETEVYGLESEAYDIPTIAQALNAKLDTAKLVSQQAEFNLTGGTKAMSFAAYQVAQQHNAPILYLESEGKRNRAYHYIWEQQKLTRQSDELLPECVTLKDLFDLHFGLKMWQELGIGRAEGSPFEAALSKALHSHGYEVMVGIRAMNGQIDIDVALRFENQFGIIEAKIDDSGRRLDGIKQLSNAVRHLGTYTQTFYAINVEKNDAHNAIAEASRIRVLSLRHYSRGSDTLTSEDTDTLITTVNQVLKG